jgi:cobalt-zinc-cadmium efflux system outer membrane protein
MFRYISAALLCAAALGLATVAAAGPTGRASAVTIEEAVRRAIDASPGLRARDELVAGADAHLRQSGAWPNPTVEGQFENFGGSGRFSDIDQSELTLGLTQRIETAGKREGRVAVANAERASAALDRERTLLDVRFDARKAFVEVVAAQVALDNAGARLKAAKEIETMAARRVNAARDPITVKLRAEIQTAEARTAQAQSEHDLHNAKRTLALLWGEPDATFEADASSLKPPPGVKRDLAALPSPDVKAREIAAKRAAAKVELEQANGRSDVSVGLGVRRFENGGDLAGVLTLSMPLAIFDSNQGNVDRAAAERRAADLEVEDAHRRYLAALVTLEEEVARSRAEYDAVHDELLPRAKAALKAARHGYDAGAFGYQELAEAQRILNELNEREVEALRTLHIAHASLDRLTGGAAGASADQGAKQ